MICLQYAFGLFGIVAVLFEGGFGITEAHAGQIGHNDALGGLLSLGIDSDLGALVADMRYINFVADLEERYNIAYAFAENYPEALREYLVSSGSYMRFSAFAIDGKIDSPSLSLIIVKRDSVKMSANPFPHTALRPFTFHEMNLYIFNTVINRYNLLC